MMLEKIWTLVMLGALLPLTMVVYHAIRVVRHRKPQHAWWVLLLKGTMLFNAQHFEAEGQHLHRRMMRWLLVLVLYMLLLVPLSMLIGFVLRDG